jgi:hypothetical protein
MPRERAARIEDTWRSAIIEARERAPQVRAVPGDGDRSPEAALAVLAEEIATYGHHLPQLMREDAGRFVLIKGADILGTFPDGPRRCEKVTVGSESSRFLSGRSPIPNRWSISPTWCLDRMPRLEMLIGCFRNSPYRAPVSRLLSSNNNCTQWCSDAGLVSYMRAR